MKTTLKLIAGASLIALSTAAGAADLAVKAPVAPVVPAINWTGWHIGFHAGAGWGDKTWNDRLIQDDASYSTSGWVGGAQLGYDLQAGPVVIGVEGEWSWANLDGNGTTAQAIPTVGGTPGQLKSEINWLASAGGRVGLVSDKALIYAKVAAVWVDESQALTASTGARQQIDDGRIGFLLGAGVEYWIAPILSAKLEYNYDDFGSKSYAFPQVPSQTGLEVDNKQRLHVFKLGVNYRFAPDVPLFPRL